MPSTTRGSILISTANDIGSTLVDKLGGDGYTPEEWDSAANLCGIASADISTALSNIQESTPGGADRGSISIAKANSIGRILNKKFDTSRGFKPSEWASSIDKLTPLEVKSASGAIASFSDGADCVPVKSCVVSFTPSGGGGSPSQPVSIQGVSGLSVGQSGINIHDNEWETGWIDNNGADYSHNERSRSKNYNLIKGGSDFRVVCPVNWRVVFYDASKAFISYLGTYTTDRDITAPSNAVYFRFAIVSLDTSNIGLNYPKTETSYVASHVSVVTDTFGQTIYGGTRDLTTDEMKVTWGYIASYNGETLTGRWVSSMDTYVAGTTPTIGAEVAYELATPTEITGLTPHEIDTLYGDNNIYADTGTTEVEYRADIDLALNA